MSHYDDIYDDPFQEPLNLTSEDIDFEGIDDDLASFQEDEMVKQALQRGVDLRKYADELDKELKDVRRPVNVRHFIVHMRCCLCMFAGRDGERPAVRRKQSAGPRAPSTDSRLRCSVGSNARYVARISVRSWWHQ